MLMEEAEKPTRTKARSLDSLFGQSYTGDKDYFSLTGEWKAKYQAILLDTPKINVKTCIILNSASVMATWPRS